MMFLLDWFPKIPAGVDPTPIYVAIIGIILIVLYYSALRSGKMPKIIQGFLPKGDDPVEMQDYIEPALEPPEYLLKNLDTNKTSNILGFDLGQEDEFGLWNGTFILDNGEVQAKSTQVRVNPHYNLLNGIVVFEYSKKGVGDIKDRETIDLKKQMSGMMLTLQSKDREIDEMRKTIKEQIKKHRETFGAEHRAITPTGTFTPSRYKEDDRQFSDDGDYGVNQ